MSSKYYQKVIKDPNLFVIIHYAGTVPYNVSRIKSWCLTILKCNCARRRMVSWRRTVTR